MTANDPHELALMISFAPEVFRALLPTWIPGQIIEVDPKYPKGCFIRPLINLSYPHGEPVTLVKCADRKGLGVGELVEFTHKPASSKEKKEKQQPDLIQVDQLKQASPRRIEELQSEYGERVVAEVLAKALPGLAQMEKRIAELNTNIDHQVSKALQARSADLRRQEKEASAKAAIAEQTLQNAQEKERLLEQARAELQQEQTRFESVQGPALRLYEVMTQQPERVNLTSKTAKRTNPLAFGPEFLGQLKSYLVECGYFADEPILQQFVIASLVACAFGDLVLLAGPTGVGKTGLIEKLAYVFGAGNAIVPVRPAWTDPTDLLGFYNPVQSQYHTTAFLESLLAANDYLGEDRLYFTCLDEMNLARIENYAADILAKLEKSRSDDASLRLYSDETWHALLTEYQVLSAMADQWKHDDSKRFHLLRSQIERLKAEIKIPRNLILCGTLNVDETVPMPSPKTLDRSYVVQFPAISLTATNPLITNSWRSQPDIHTWLSYKDTCDLTHTDIPDAVTKDIAALWDTIVSWESQYLYPLGLSLGYRFAVAFGRYMRCGYLLSYMSPAILATGFLKAKLLPRISFLKEEAALSGEGRDKKITVWEKWRQDTSIGKFPDLDATLDNITQANIARVVIQYWL